MNSDFEKCLAALAAEHRAARAPLSVERAVLSQYDAFRRRRSTRLVTVGTLAGTIAATLVMGALLLRERPARHPAAIASSVAPGPVAPGSAAKVTAVTAARVPVKKARPRKISAATPPAEPANPFVAIPYTVPLQPGERAMVLRMSLSASAMAAIGMPLPAIDPSSEAQADVLVGEDGRARAIRVVASSDFQ